MTIYGNYGDDELVALLKQGDRAAFTELYNRYKTQLYLHAYRVLQNDEEAKDLIQEMFTVLWAKRDDLKIKTSFESYLYSAVKNRALDFMAHQKVIDKYTAYFTSFVEEGIDADDERMMNQELIAIIQNEVNQLPKKMKQIFEMSRYEGLSYRQIAEKLGITEMTVKKQLNNASNILKPRIKMNVIFFLFL